MVAKTVGCMWLYYLMSSNHFGVVRIPRSFFCFDVVCRRLMQTRQVNQCGGAAMETRSTAPVLQGMLSVRIGRKDT
jgi:hypothetical protein